MYIAEHISDKNPDHFKAVLWGKSIEEIKSRCYTAGVNENFPKSKYKLKNVVVNTELTECSSGVKGSARIIEISRI